MRLVLELCPTLPPLAWCAQLQDGDATVHVTHGAAVERRANGLVAGVWDGPFADSSPVDAVLLAGTALELRDGALWAAAGSNLCDRLYVAGDAQRWWISNSSVFALCAAGDALCIERDRYALDHLAQVRAGIYRGERSVPTHRGQLQLFEFVNVVFAPPSPPAWQRKRQPPVPGDVDAYIAELSACIGRVLDNAVAAGRQRRYEPIATLSAGYDCNAVAALARPYGLRQAFTYDDVPADSGADVGAALGLEVVGRPRDAYRDRRDLPEAQFAVNPRGAPVGFASFEDVLRGRLVLTGIFGDDILGLEPRLRPDLAQRTFGGLGGVGFTEFGLALPAIQLAPLHYGAQWAAAITALARAEAMRPARIGGRYDRPIARRILRDAGVADALFGQRKWGGGSALRGPAQLGAHSRADYEDFVRAHAPLAARARVTVGEWSAASLGRVAAAGAARGWWRPPSAAGAPRSFLLQWGVARTAERYRDACAAISSVLPGTSSGKNT